jgi:fluoride exporter
LEGRLERIALIAVAGAFGTVSRYGLQLVANHLLGPTVLGTFLVNMSGALAIGLLVGFTEERMLMSTTHRIALAVGFLGAYTTFSTLMIESVDRIESGRMLLAAANIMGSVFVGLISVYAGLLLGRAVS